MKIPKIAKTHRKESLLAARAMSIPNSIILLAAVLVWTVTGDSTLSTILLWIGIFLVAASALEMVNVWYIDHVLPTKPIDMPPRPCTPTPTFELINDFENGEWYERRVLIDDQCVVFRVAPKVFVHIEREVNLLASETPRIADAYHRFISRSKDEDPSFSEEIMQLRLDSLDFFVDKPEAKRLMAEVSFTNKSGGESWTCLWDGAEFRDLQRNT
jgi:hypothetical protein